MIQHPYQGTFFVMEGVNGSGKSDRAKSLSLWLAAKYSLNIREVKEPGKDRKFGKMIYEDLNTPNGMHKTDPFRFQRLYACDSKQNVVDNIIPILATKGGVCVADRYRHSMVHSAKDKNDFDELMRINECILGEHFFWPEMAFIFDVSPSTAMKRLRAKGRELDGHEAEDQIAQTRQNYLDFAERYPNCCVISAEGLPEEIDYQVQAIAERILRERGQI